VTGFIVRFMDYVWLVNQPASTHTPASSAPNTLSPMPSDATLVVEIHVPLTADQNAQEGENRFPWIDDVSELIAEVEESGSAFVVDEGDEFEGSYVVVITGADESTLLTIANRVANLPGVPTGVFAVVTDDDAEELGQGRREDIS